jgi:hypothetical protein
MASEEQYLWVFTFELHDEKRLWWAYFHTEQEAEAWMAGIMRRFPCLQAGAMEEQPEGLWFLFLFCHHAFSNQKLTDRMHPRQARKRDDAYCPLAPHRADYLTSFALSLDGARLCERCAAEKAALLSGTKPLEVESA